jgi:uncharacterized protein YndB with AHSA1/START domain
MTAIDAIDSIAIQAPPADVFAVVSDYANTHTWFPIYRCVVQNAGPIHAGVQVEHIYGKPPLVMSRFVRRIDRIEPGRRLEESYIAGDLRGTGVWTFDPDENGTLAAYHCQVDGARPFTRLAFEWIGNRAHSATYRKLLAALKRRCER